MKAIPFDGANKTFETKRKGEADMPVYTDGVSHVSCWEPTDEDLKNIIETRKIYVVVVSGPEPPAMGLTSSNPVPLIQLHPAYNKLPNLRNEN